MWSEPEMRTPASGFWGAYFSRIAINPGISFSAIEISFRPKSASEMSLTLKSCFVFVFVLIINLFRRLFQRDNIVRDPTSHVSRAAIDFARIFSGKCAAAVASHAAVAIDNNLAAGQTGVALRSADHEIAGGIDEKLRALA